MVVEESIFKLLVFVVILVVIRSIFSILMNFIRAEQHTKTYNIIESTIQIMPKDAKEACNL